MKNKKGFTLVEIIVCITVIVLITTISFVSKNYLKKKQINDLLIEMQSKIYEAVNVYLETKDVVNTNLYDNGNAVVIPLNVLVKEGYIDLNNLNVDNHYVLSVLGSTVKESSCIDTTLVGSWEKENDTIIYLCTNVEIPLNEINSKFTELETRITNIENILNTLNSNNIKKSDLTNVDGYYYAQGANPNNYVKIKNNGYESIWRIVSISNDNIVLIGTEEKLLVAYKDYFSLSLYNNVLREFGEDSDKPLNINYINDTYIERTKYYWEFSYDAGHGGVDIAYFSKEYNSYLGLPNYSNLINSKSIDGSYLIKILETYNAYIGYSSTNGNDGKIAKFDNSSGVDYDLYGPRMYFDGNIYSNKNVMPLITLKKCVNIKKDTSCSNKNKSGSENCPFSLDYSSC